jgi:nucleotide-binding universal stress UspA family protein
MLALKTILHPTDFSAPSECAFRLACSLARDHGAQLVLFHVVELPTPAYGEGTAPVTVIQMSLDAEREALDQIQAPPGISMERKLVEGDAADEIIEAAKEVEADLIVLGTHGRTGLGRLLLGSVAEQVLRRALCPVLTVKSGVRPSIAAPPIPAALGEPAR